MKKASEECANYFKLTGRKAILIIDEIHRFNKLQQDSLLPWVEHGSFILIGATTENPSFKLNSALLSRCRVFQLKKLSQQAIVAIIKRATKIKLELYDKNFVVVENDKNDSESKKESNSEINVESKLELKSDSKLEIENDIKANSINKKNDDSNITDSTTNNCNNNNNNIYANKEVLELLAVMSDGDARNALNV